MQRKSIQHESKVNVGNTPLPEKMLGILPEQTICKGEELLGRVARGRGERRCGAAIEHDFGRSFNPQWQKVTPKPCLNLSGARPRLRRLRV